jgi:cobaltochelatase CobN
MSDEVTSPVSLRFSHRIILLLERRTSVNRAKVKRPDGKVIHVVPKRGQLFVCALGCCCGRTEDGFAPVPSELYHAEWERRKLRNTVHLTQTACLGPCALANVVLLIVDGQAAWFHSIASEEHVLALYDYIEDLLAAEHPLPPPLSLRENVFDGFDGSAGKRVPLPVLT